MKKIKYAIGIDIGGTNTVAGLVTKDGDCNSKDFLKTENYEDVNLFISDLSEIINRFQYDFHNEEEIVGIGIGAPNGNYYKGTIEFAPNLKWKGVINFVDLLKKHFDLPIFLTNDANAAALGEMIYGGAKEMKDFMVVTLGTGLGSGIVVNGQILYGHDGFAGELGHTIVNPEGRQCGCGRKGCLETYVSATGIKNTVFELLDCTEEASVLRNVERQNISSKLISESAINNDSIALQAFEYTGEILGLKLADTIAITSPEAIFLFGGLALAGDLIFRPTKYWMEHYLLPIFKNKVKLLPSLLPENNAAILGASALVWKNLEL